MNTPPLVNYKKSILDPVTNAVLSSSEFVVSNNKIQSETLTFSNGNPTRVKQYTYVNQLLSSIITFQGGSPNGERVDYVYNTNGRLIEKLTTFNSSNFIKLTYAQIGNTTTVVTSQSTDGVNFVAQQGSTNIFTDSNDNITGFNGTNPSINFATATTLTYDANGNVTNASTINTQNGNVGPPFTFTLTYTGNVVNPFSSLMNDTFTKYGNNLNYVNIPGGINTTIRSTFLSPYHLDTYVYGPIQGTTTITSVLNTNGLLTSFRYLTTLNGNPFTLVEEEFTYQ